MTTAEYILKYFRGRKDYVAIPLGDKGFQPKELAKPMRPKWLEKEHLSQKRCLGFYVLTKESRCYCSAVDFDNKPDVPDPEWQMKASAVYYELVGYGLSPVVEISQSGSAAHVWLFFDEAIDAWLVRQFWDAVSKKSGVQFVEVYPRQDELSGKQLGNLIRYPLFNQSKFVDVENEWSELTAEEALSSAEFVEEDKLKTLIYHMVGSSPKKPEMGFSDNGLPVRVDRLVSKEHTLLGKRWRGQMEGLNDRSRSALVMSLACEMVRLYVPTPEVEQAIRIWCEQNDYKKGERDDWIGTTVQKAYELLGSRDSERSNTSQTLHDACRELVKNLSQEAPTIPTGLAELDRSIDGVAIGEMAVIAARPSHGKTAFGMWWVYHAAAERLPCLLISEEMSKRELSKRALLSISKLSVEDWTEDNIQMLSEIDRHEEVRAPIYLIESCQSIDAVEEQVRQHTELHGVRLVAVDYLQLLNAHSSTRYESVTEISKRLKQMAVKFQCAMLVMCQLNREIEKREKKQPLLSDLRESGQIEQDADLILFLQWPWKIDSELDPEQYLVWCSKRRNGPIRMPMITTKFDPGTQSFGVGQTDLDWQGNPEDYAAITN